MPLDPTILLAGAQSILGTAQAIGGSQRAKRLLQMRTPYSTPEEYYKLLQLTQSMASQGYDAFTLNYLTGQNEQAFSQTLGVSERLGGNPNDLSALFHQSVNQAMKIGAENHALNMENIGKFLSSLDIIGQNKAAEWKSREDILKDQLQAASADKQSGFQNILSGANAFIAAYANAQTEKLFTQNKDQTTTPAPRYSTTLPDVTYPTVNRYG